MACLLSTDLNGSPFPSPRSEYPFRGLLTRTHQESMRGGCVVFREMQGYELNHSQSPPNPHPLWMPVFMAFGTKQPFQFVSSKDTGSFLAFDRGVSHKA